MDTRVRSRRRLVGWVAVAASAVAGLALVLHGLQVPNDRAAPLPTHQYAVDPAAAPDPVTAPVPTLASANPSGDSAVPAESDPAGPAESASSNDTVSPAAAVAGAWHAADPDPAKRQQTPQVPVTDRHLIIPAIGVDAAVEITDRVGGSLQLPTDVAEVTVWSGSASVTAQHGTLLVAGHIDNVHQGMGALYFIHTLNAGDAVYLAMDDTVTRWKVTALQTVDKLALPQDVWAGDDGPRQLKLVTCGGAVHNGSYDDNVIVTAVPF